MSSLSHPMAIAFSCECGKRLKTPDDWGGRWVRCTACKRELLVPLPQSSDLGIDPEPVRAGPAPAPPPNWQPVQHVETTRPRPVIAAPPPELDRKERSWRGFIFWLLLLAAVPLAVDAFTRDHGDTLARLRQTIEADPKLAETYGHLDDDELSESIGADEDRFFSALPENRIRGALLPKSSLLHWGYAFIAGILFLGFVIIALPGLPARPLHLLLAGLFTGTLGVLLLTIIQVFGMFCFCCLGAMYLAALDPSAPFGASLLGHFLGVGLCEEMIKSLPVLWRIYRPDYCGWREACLWGMASGAGFGVSESIFYAANYYNGVEGPDIYVVRFVSLVAFHTMLSGSCAILLLRHQHHLEAEQDYFEWGITFMAIISIPMFLHGLFNTLGKKGYDLSQVGLWALSFAWLAYLIHSSRKRESGLSRLTASGPAIVRTAHGTRVVPR
ncbi:MAG TPA: PrsW family glutamic-type intramembrane protease [Tepidisphaeraceae bacterium]|nr:PrsW family glutamic-type intramembrane protease [Tepidisphaeraceae bacterium]